MTPKQVLIEAAQRIDKGWSSMCCYALDAVADDNGSWFEAGYEREQEALDAAMHFERLFSPYIDAEGDLVQHATKDGMEFWSEAPTPKRQKVRVLCLLFAAHSYKDMNK